MSPAWEGTLHIGRHDPLKVELEHDGSGMFYQGCCQCRLVHLVKFRRSGGALLFDFVQPDADIAASIEGARVKAEDDQIQLLLKEKERLESENAKLREELSRTHDLVIKKASRCAALEKAIEEANQPCYCCRESS